MRYVGARVQPGRGPRLLTGHGTYVDDIVAAGHAARVLRAQPVRARHDPRHRHVGARRVARRALRVHRGRPQRRREGAVAHVDGQGRARRRRARRSPTDEVRFVGDPVALVVAETHGASRDDAAELVDVDYEPLPAVVDYTTAEPADALVHAAHGSNVVGELAGLPLRDARRRVRVGRARRRARRSTSRRTLPRRWRAAASSSTTRAATGELTIYAATQAPHEVRLFCSRLLGIPEHRIRVVMRDTGGGFGQKVLVQRDEMCVMLAASKVGAPLKWVEDRRENLLAAGKSRQEHGDARRWRSTPTAGSWPRTSTSCRTAARTRRRGR